MSKFSAFLSQNVEKKENVKFVLSKRFKDENGKPIEWEIKPLGTPENSELQRKCYVSVPVPNQRNQFTRQLDQIKYTAELLAASVVFPDLNDAELQDSYGVKTPVALLEKMLYPNEQARLAEKVMAFSEIEDLDDLIEEAKN